MAFPSSISCPRSAQDSQEQDWHASGTSRAGAVLPPLAGGQRPPRLRSRAEKQPNAPGERAVGPCRAGPSPGWGGFLEAAGHAGETRAAGLDPPPGRRPPGEAGDGHACVEVPPRQPMPGSGPALPGDEQILAEDKESLINQKLDNGGNTLIIFSSRVFWRSMFAQRVGGNGEGEGAAMPGESPTPTRAGQGWGGGLAPGGSL